MLLRCLWLLITLTSSLIYLTSASSSSRNPLSRITVVNDPVIDSPKHRVSAHSSFELSFTTWNRRIRLSLGPNNDIIPHDAQIHYLGADGEVTHSEPLDRLSHKVYRGSTWAQNLDGSFSQVGHARITVHRDGPSPMFEGAFDIEHDYHHIELHSNYRQTKHPEDPESLHPLDDHMVIYRDSDITTGDSGHEELKKRSFSAHDHVSGACGADTLEFNMDSQHPLYTGITPATEDDFWSVPVAHLFGKRQLDTSTGAGNSAGVNLVQSIGNTAGCPSTRKIALVGVATDCTYTAAFKSNDEVRNNVINSLNSASRLYEQTFNISLGLQAITISPPDCPGSPPAATPWNQACSTNVQIQDRLNLFSQWRSRQQDSNSHWTLLTTCNTGTAVGLAWLGQACVINADPRNSTTGVQTVAGANVVARTGGSSEWQIIAHETGHTFGAVHDCTSQTCSDGTVTKQQCCPLSSGTCDAGQKYIMNPSTAQGITQFSPCSVGNICSAMGRGSVKSTCLSANKGVPLITNAVCGNGIVEEGEDCDCGGSATCGNNPCCNPTTCKFKAGAVCDDSNEECCKSCQFASANTVCRKSTGVCDPEEKCSGTNATCPTDITAPDGQGCGSGLKCASGHCSSRNLQCQQLMGTYLNGNNDTYACDSQTCQLSCASPEFGPGVCYGLQQNFLDGTECGGGGKCTNGVCKGSNFGKEIKSWIDDHKTLVIGVCSAVGGIIVLLILNCIYRSVRRKRRGIPPRGGMWHGRKPAASPPQQSMMGMRQHDGVPYGVPPPVYYNQRQESWRYG